MDAKLIVSFRKEFPRIRIEGEFEFERGFNVILGPSGCGKTTTFRIICGLENPDEGFIRCCEEVFLDTRKDIYLPPQKRRLGVVFQEDNLLPHLSVKENIEFATRKAGGKVENIDELIEHFGLEALKDKKPKELSGGEKQRVAIVRALASNPRALLMDEPFSSLDFRRKMSIMEFLKGLKFNIPVVIVTHDPFETLFLADKVFIMEKGRKVCEGGRELVEGVFSELLKLSGAQPSF
ncbi:molybdate transport system ATP-binding protein [Hydrogenivirga caldilitoris]|uniref:Molybdate transport system ATP-binding protein n=1 Tax=Hydrogenivirga caldilitoris TaxID=246264 RepID=A0A497XQG4_9AQUI|nr:ATP-binding cassette domain-containing protein [Hydrogenivirga caldilitoris]RLJ70390.1 molybdate transport system ATP-binding protein [Hydrogenivirga caldilitoris]